MTINRDSRSAAAGKKRTNQTTKKRERKLNRLLVQLIASAAIFLLVFVGGGLIPEQVFDVFGSVRQVVSGDDSLLQSVEALGQAVSEGENWPQAVRQWCVDTFLPTSTEERAEEDNGVSLETSAQYHRHLLPQTIDDAVQQTSAAAQDKQ